eukprot:TRINITY_DN5448_c0_g1_i3.p1 TRINITY_DN5448_c0_g1~~TRINITY_DN5448_c0_g1_i3.p1  ORF type:complete len:405 (-),score=48.88 TRINITY_DN5448_c0_g1_i3:48-1262(-)
MKMTGPYTWVPPNYWMTDNARWGGAWGFLSEGGPGETLLEYPSLRRTLQEDDLWPIGDAWDFHCGRTRFSNLDYFNNALYARYGKAASAVDYTGRAQVAAFESVRAMFESFNRNKYISTGVIFWMLNNAWPSMIWHLYDYYLTPGSSYFAAKCANEPLHVQYGYDDHCVWVVPNTRDVTVGERSSVVATMYDTAGRTLFSATYNISIAVNPDMPFKVAPLPQLRPRGHVYFLLLTLLDNQSATESSNFYWLPTKPDVLNWNESNWWSTPCSSYADFTSLQDLPPVILQITWAADNRTNLANNATVYETEVVVTNPSQVIAFFIRFRLFDNDTGEEVLPVVWDHNYISLLPAERRTLHATTEVRVARPWVREESWNNNVARGACSREWAPSWLVVSALLFCVLLL